MVDVSPEVLRDLPRFVQAFPPASPFLVRRESDAAAAAGPLYLHPHQRLLLQLESTSDIGYGLWRSEQLAEAGISCAECDAESFAAGLVAQLADHLSIRNLQAIVSAFQAELDRMESRRLEALARTSR